LIKFWIIVKQKNKLPQLLTITMMSSLLAKIMIKLMKI